MHNISNFLLLLSDFHTYLCFVRSMSPEKESWRFYIAKRQWFNGRAFALMDLLECFVKMMTCKRILIRTGGWAIESCCCFGGNVELTVNVTLILMERSLHDFILATHHQNIIIYVRIPSTWNLKSKANKWQSDNGHFCAMGWSKSDSRTKIRYIRIKTKNLISLSSEILQC